MRVALLVGVLIALLVLAVIAGAVILAVGSDDEGTSVQGPRGDSTLVVSAR